MLEILKSRRSIRNFNSGTVEYKIIEDILDAGMHAPSARNQQPWHFIVITEKEKMDTLSEIHPYAQMLKTAAACIIVCADLNLEKSQGYSAIDCAAATQNILLAAHSFKLGSVWLGVYPREERMTAMSSLLSLPEHVFAFSMIAIGYPNENPVATGRFKPERIHYQGW
ncbi:MAG: nitroreductase family protein [Bacteroidetes bacterium HGW-Bacteroidetes-21]|jgi:nitroreductase|nr:MAG: nitroreductase family protein [Bacteroidetes bacterium HGW-Bacteroidetes-21]